MRFNNSKAKKWVPVLYFLLLLLVLGAIFYALVIDKEFEELKYWNFIPVILLIIIITIYTTAKYFEFDSDGNVLTFINKGLFISDYINYREQRAEFPKEKLSAYKLQNYFIFSYLNIYIKSKGSTVKRVRFNISLLGQKKKNALKSSLDKVIKHNKEIS